MERQLRRTSAMAVVEGNDGFVLTKAQSTLLRGGGDRGGSRRGYEREGRRVFAVASLNGNGRKLWLGAASCARREMRTGAVKASGRRWLEVEGNGSGVRPASARGRAIRDPATGGGHAASGLCIGRP